MAEHIDTKPDSTEPEPIHVSFELLESVEELKTIHVYLEQPESVEEPTMIRAPLALYRMAIQAVATMLTFKERFDALERQIQQLSHDQESNASWVRHLYRGLDYRLAKIEGEEEETEPVATT
jgi:hypothetical protein